MFGDILPAFSKLGPLEYGICGIFATVLLVFLSPLVLSLCNHIFKSMLSAPVLQPGKAVDLTLIEKEEINWNTRKFTFALPSSSSYLGLPPGKHVYLGADDVPNPRTGEDAKRVARPYSPVTSDEDKGIVSIVFKVYFHSKHPRFPDGGMFTQYLNNLLVGASVSFKGPIGKVHYLGDGVFSMPNPAKPREQIQRKFKNVAMVGGGTGLTPLFSIIKWAIEHGDNVKFGLLSANASPDDLLLDAELDSFAKNANVDVSYTVDRDETDGTWKQGRKTFQGFVSEDMVKQTCPGPSEDTLFLACGPPIMIEKCIQPICDSLGYKNVHFF